MLIHEFFTIKNIDLPKSIVMSQLSTIIKEPVILSAPDAAFIISLLVVSPDTGRMAKDKDSREKVTAVDILTNGSKRFRE